MIRHEGKVDCRTRRLKEIQEAIARKKEARMFIIQEKKRVRQSASELCVGGDVLFYHQVGGSADETGCERSLRSL